MGTLERMLWCPPTELSFWTISGSPLEKSHGCQFLWSWGRAWARCTQAIRMVKKRGLFADHRGFRESMMDTIRKSKLLRWQTCLASRKCGVRFMKAADSTVTLPQKEVMISAQNDLFWILWEMKKFVRRWWAEHDTPEFGHSIVAGTMRRMQECAKLNGLPVCDYYTVSV